MMTIRPVWHEPPRRGPERDLLDEVIARIESGEWTAVEAITQLATALAGLLACEPRRVQRRELMAEIVASLPDTTGIFVAQKVAHDARFRRLVETLNPVEAGLL